MAPLLKIMQFLKKPGLTKIIIPSGTIYRQNDKPGVIPVPLGTAYDSQLATGYKYIPFLKAHLLRSAA